LVAEEKLWKVVVKQALKELKAVATLAKIIHQKLKTVSTLPKTPQKHNISTLSPIIELSPVKKQKVVVFTTTKGRAILRPQRFVL
jgi:hypothetical protein